MDAKPQEQDWRTDVSEPKATLKLADKEIVSFVFIDEGKKSVHQDYGESVVFSVKKTDEDENRLWFVNAKNFDLQRQIKALGTLTGMKVKLKRIGSKKSDTRYVIEKSN